jgi:hypothetical protein
MPRPSAQSPMQTMGSAAPACAILPRTNNKRPREAAIQQAVRACNNLLPVALLEAAEYFVSGEGEAYAVAKAQGG